jgi:hypothetical protein
VSHKKYSSSGNELGAAKPTPGALTTQLRHTRKLFGPIRILTKIVKHACRFSIHINGTPNQFLPIFQISDLQFLKKDKSQRFSIFVDLLVSYHFTTPGMPID